MDLNKLYLRLDSGIRCNKFDSCQECRSYYGIDPDDDFCVTDEYEYIQKEFVDYLKNYLDNRGKVDISEDEVMQLLKDCELWTE